MRDLFCYDDKLKFKPFDVLMARDEGHHLFKPDLWGFDKEKVNYVWKLILGKETTL